MNDDRITLRGIRARGRHGVLRDERENGQGFVVDVDLHMNHVEAARSDSITDTVNYDELAKAIVADIAGEPLNLIESLAERIAQTVLQEPGVAAVEVVVHKPEAPVSVPVTDVSATVFRTRSSGGLGSAVSSQFVR